MSVKGSEGSPVTGSVCITARCEQECDVSECSGCLSRPAPLFLLSYCPLSPSHASLSPLPKTPLFAPQTLLSLSISLLSRCSCFTVHFLNLGFCAQFCPSLSSHVFTAFLTWLNWCFLWFCFRAATNNNYFHDCFLFLTYVWSYKILGNCEKNVFHKFPELMVMFSKVLFCLTSSPKLKDIQFVIVE